MSGAFEVVRNGETHTITTRCICIPDPPFEPVLGLPTIDAMIPEMKTTKKLFQKKKEAETTLRTI